MKKQTRIGKTDDRWVKEWNAWIHFSCGDEDENVFLYFVGNSIFKNSIIQYDLQDDIENWQNREKHEVHVRNN